MNDLYLKYLIRCVALITIDKCIDLLQEQHPKDTLTARRFLRHEHLKMLVEAV